MSVPTHARRAPSAVLALIPLLLVNSVAFAGQLAFLRDHLGWPLPGDIAFALALESIAVYLAYHAHVALLADDSALRLRLAAYGFAAVIGAMNYSHYSHHWRPTFAAVALGLLSASSPWLWGVHSRRASRDALMTAGLIERRALRLGSTRWLWHPIRSARVMWHATWTGERRVTEAIAVLDVERQEPEPEPEPRPAIGAEPERPALPGGPEAEHAIVLRNSDSEAARIRYALRVTGTDKPADAGRWLAEHGYPVDPVNVRSVIRRERQSRGRAAPVIQIGRAASGERG